VALLARPGAARERLREALSHADVQLVLEDDPNTLETRVLQEARPQFVVIALEAAIEDALERLEAVLSAPGLTLVFDEAELAARRDGWEAQRWVRQAAWPPAGVAAGGRRRTQPAVGAGPPGTATGAAGRSAAAAPGAGIELGRRGPR